MQTVQAAATTFLSKRRIAVTGVSRHGERHGANTIYKRLRERGYEAFAVNPNAQRVEGDACYPDLAAIPGGVDAVVIATRPEHAMGTMRSCVELGVGQVWMHHGAGESSVSAQATAFGREHGITVIDGGCPLMFGPTSDFGHRLMKIVYASKVPTEV
jgi:predicted CoA-binding protein